LDTSSIKPSSNMSHHDIEESQKGTHAHYEVASPAPAQASAHIIANPGPLGLCGFALTTFVLSLCNCGAGVSATGPSNIVVGLAMFYGGVVQLLAGMWEFQTGNTFGATAFSSYGGFWLSFGAIFIPGFGILEAYTTKNAAGVSYAGELENAVGLYLLGWTIFTGIMLIAAHRSSGGMVALFFFLFVTFILLTASKFNGSITCQVAGGALGVITAFIAWYNALAGLLTTDNSYFTLPIFPFRR
jgi:succinate-acetate transporter protein